jgi:hypothetical protein
MVGQQEADTVLFIGKAVRLLKSPQGALRGTSLLPAEEALQMKALLDQLQARVRFDAMAFTKALEVIRAKVGAGACGAGRAGAIWLAGCSPPARVAGAWGSSLPISCQVAPAPGQGRWTGCAWLRLPGAWGWSDGMRGAPSARQEHGARRPGLQQAIAARHGSRPAMAAGQPLTRPRGPAPQVAGRLWELVVRRSELTAHLEALKDYFLLARGDFWDCFLVDAQRLLAAPPNVVTADQDIRQPFQAAGSKTSAAGDPLFAAFSARWLAEPQRVRGGAEGACACAPCAGQAAPTRCGTAGKAAQGACSRAFGHGRGPRPPITRCMAAKQACTGNEASPHARRSPPTPAPCPARSWT